MTDKEEIIIDSVNVAGCVRLQDDEISCDLGGECKGWGNCYYKQLARKTQECEKLSILAQEESARNGYVEYELNDKLKQKTQECENLKAEEKYLKQCCQKAGEELAKHSFEYDGKEKNLVVQAIELNEKYEKLKKALEKIERVCEKSSTEWEAYKDETCIFHCKTRKTDKAKLADKILNIINKAKGETNA